MSTPASFCITWFTPFLKFYTRCRARLFRKYGPLVNFKVKGGVFRSEIAKSLDSDSYGLVFGANQFFALVAQTVLTVLVTEVFNLNIKTQFFLYGAYFIVLGVSFIIAGVVTLSRWKTKAQE